MFRVIEKGKKTVRKQFQKFLFSAAVSVFALTAGACGDEKADPTVQPTESVKPTKVITPTQAVPTDFEPTKEAEPTKEEPTKEPEPTKGEASAADVKYTKLEITESMITSSEPWNNGPDVAANAFDGDTSTFFDGVEEGWIRVDLGKEYLIGKIGYAPRSGYEARLNGTFYGSLDGRTWYEIYKIPSAPSSMKETDYTEFATVSSFRFVKYENIADCANISEIVLYSAEGIPEELVEEIGRETYADGTYEMLDQVPQDLGMVQAGVDTAAMDEISAAACDNNPSTIANAGTGEIVVALDKAYTLGAIAYMGGENEEISPADLKGGEFYGSEDGKTWVQLYKINTPPDKVCSTFVYYGELATTGSYRFIKYQNPNGRTAVSEIRVYAMENPVSVSLTALPFATNAKGNVDNIALYWGSSLSADEYEIYRAGTDGNFQLVYTGKGTSWQDYSLPLGEYTYKMKMRYGSTVLESGETKAESHAMPDVEFKVIDNQNAAGGLSTRAGFYSDGLYYSYNLSVSNGRAKVTEQTSKDGYHFSGSARTVLDDSAHELLKSCKIESTKMVYVESLNKVVLVAHWEKPDGYADGKLLLATCTPGEEFTLHGIWNPEGIEVRDMSIFVDDDDTGYLLAAANEPGQGANATIYVFRFTDDFTGIDSIAVKLFENQYREMPNVVKLDGWYYLFVSQTAGWYPSSGAYASSRSMTEGWSELREIGNTSTFSSQSSWIAVLGEGGKHSYLMHAYRWIAGEGTSTTMLAPITFSDGIAYYDYFPKILYNAETGDMVPLASGKLLSQGCPVTSTLGSAPGSEPSNITDGNYFSAYTADSASWPVSLTIDLGRECELTNIQISWYICKGSEGYYMYDVYGSADGETWEVLCENSDEKKTTVSKTYGFNSNRLSGKARYVKLTVNGARLQNNPDYNWYTPTIYEVKVFGKEEQ